MVTIAICGDIPVAQGSAADVLARCARDVGVSQPALLEFPSAFELLERLEDTSAELPVDLVVLRAGQQGMSAIQAVRDARKSGFGGEFILVEETSAHAPEALRLRVAAYLELPLEQGAFEAEAARVLARLAARDASSVTMRMRGGVRRVHLEKLVMAQTQNHDQVLRMRDGSTMQLRCSSQELFGRLSHDERFLKLGSSYIVNLDLVQSLDTGSGTLAFVDGSTASVPVRLRKSVQDALFARAEWRKHAC